MRHVRLSAVLVCVALTDSCAATYPPADRLGAAERPHPTPAQIRALLDAPLPAAAVLAGAFRLVLTPPIVVVGGGVWVTCYVPAAEPAREVYLGIPALSSSTRPVDRIEHTLLIERIPCGPHVAVCALSSGRRLEQPLRVLGGDCDDG